jgi:hypothetical protein
MAVTVTVLIPAKTAEAAQTTQYTSTGVTTIIDKFTATNYSAAAATISVNLITVADSAGNDNLTVKTKTLSVRCWRRAGLSPPSPAPRRRSTFAPAGAR